MLTSPLTPVVFEELERFAGNPDDPYFLAWRRFNQTVGTDGSVGGIWHETYVVEAGRHEAIYDNMLVFVLAKATEHVPAKAGRERARRSFSRVASGLESPPDGIYYESSKRSSEERVRKEGKVYGR